MKQENLQGKKTFETYPASRIFSSSSSSSSWKSHFKLGMGLASKLAWLSGNFDTAKDVIFGRLFRTLRTAQHSSFKIGPALTRHFAHTGWMDA